MANTKDEAVGEIVQEIVVDKITGKKFYLSKTFWANVILVAASIAASQVPALAPFLTPDIQAVILGGVNLALRAVTDEPVTW